MNVSSLIVFVLDNNLEIIRSEIDGVKRASLGRFLIELLSLYTIVPEVTTTERFGPG